MGNGELRPNNWFVRTVVETTLQQDTACPLDQTSGVTNMFLQQANPGENIIARDRMTELREFARRYPAAWCTQHAASVAAFFAPGGSLTINGGEPSVGRSAIAEAAQGFMTAFPDLKIYMDSGGHQHGTRRDGDERADKRMERVANRGRRIGREISWQLRCCRVPASG